MKNLFALILVLLLLLPAAAKAEVVTIVADQWCPYNCEPNSKHLGLMIEIAKQAFAKHNIEIKYSTMPWTRAIEETRQNKHTAIVGASKQDAPDFIFPKIPQGQMSNTFYVKKDTKWRYTGIKSLPQISLGVIADYSYSDELDEYIAKHNKMPKYVQSLSGDNALEANVKKLLAGRVGAIIEGKYVMSDYLSQHSLIGKLEEAGTLPYTANDNLYIAFSPKEPKAKIYAEILAKETEIMRKNGELKKILAHYHVSDWQK
jgi:polar amino acid transport system substrate-binding protein